MGTDASNNNLNRTLGGYLNISEAFDIALPNWQMLRILDKEISIQKAEADWLDALIVAMDFMKTQIMYVWLRRVIRQLCWPRTTVSNIAFACFFS